MFSILLIIIFLIFFVLSAFFSGIETGLISVDRLKLVKDAKHSHLKQQILKFIENPDRIFGITLIGTNISNVIITTIFTIFIVDDLLINKGINIDHQYGALILTGAILLFAELLPKAIYRDHADKLVAKFFPFLKFFYILLKPFVNLVTFINNSLAKILKIEDKKLTREDISFLLSHTKNENKVQKEMLEEALEFNELKAKNVMIPRTELVAISEDAELDEIIELAREKGFTRFPVYRENLDEIIGILIVYDILKTDMDNFDLKNTMRQPHFAPESMSINSLLKEMQSLKKSMTIVVDPFGGTSGIITMEDILEEIVGDIEDEFDAEDEKDISKIADDIYVAKANIEIDVLNDNFNMNLPEGEYETLAGLVINKIAKIPKVGQKIRVNGWDLSILQASNKKIEKVKLKKRTASK